jgi:hypothetical protein
MSTWEIGDLVLVRGRRTGISRSTPIVLAQLAGGYAPEDAEWTHAAVYAGEGTVLEATWGFGAEGGIGWGEVSAYVPDDHIRVRTDALLTDEQRHEIVAQARSLEGLDYSIPRAMELARQLVLSRVPALRAAADRIPHGVRASDWGAYGGYVCSDVFAISYEAAANRTIAPADDWIVCPAALSASPHFEDRELTWCALQAPANPRDGE